MDRLEFLGFAAGFLSMIAFIPQVYKTYKIKSAEGISIQTFIIYATSTILWTIYGFILNKPALYITNIVILVVSSTQIILKKNMIGRIDSLKNKEDASEKICNKHVCGSFYFCGCA